MSKATPQPTLSILIVSYNTAALTLACLRSVFEQTTQTSFEVIVYDNCSSDDSASHIKAEFGERIQLIAATDNVGFAGGNNAAAKYATGEYLLLLNPDTVVLDQAIDHLFTFSQLEPDARIWGGRTVFGDHTLNKSSCWSKQSLWSLTVQVLGANSIFRNSSFFNPEGLGGWDREGIRQVDIVSGCFFLISRDFWDTLNGFDKDFFMYGEEADLCLRARKLGAKPVVSSAATIIHYGGKSESSQPNKLVKLIKSKSLLIRNHFPAMQRSIGLTLLALWPLSRFVQNWLLGILGNRSAQQRASVWRDVWRRRTEWRL
jgi:GT2 family glycosyltransferase